MADIITVEETAAVAMAYSLDPGFAFELIDFTLHLNATAGTSEDFTVTKNAGAGAAYDTLIYTKDLSTLSSPNVYFSTQPEEFVFEDGDTLDFAFTNTSLNTYGLQIKYRRKA